MTAIDEKHNNADAASLIKLIRDSNPNLRPVELPAQVRKPLSRKKPNQPEPNLEDIKSEHQPENRSRDLHNLFWKYHLLYFGDGLYLTTSPTPKHINCPSLPGYYVRRSGTNMNFTLEFEGIETGERIISIEKRTTRSGVSFRYTLYSERKLIESTLVEAGASIHPHSGGIYRANFPKEILLMPPDSPYINYGLLSDRYGVWNIGSVPVLVPSKISVKSPKYHGKQNIYFHDLFNKPNTLHVGETPEVVAMFRKCESSHRRRLIHSVHRLLAKDPKAFETHDSWDPFPELKPYVHVGDGLHWDIHPKDDESNHHYKLGWLTIYNNRSLLAESGMFDVVVAVTVAVAYNHIHGS